MKKPICMIGCVMMAVCTAGAGAQVKNPDTFVLADNRTVQTIDPAASYDVAGSMRIWNMYETLIFFDGSSTENYVPLLAAEVPTVANGGISADGRTYTVTIRKGVKFHAGGDLSPEDVVYPFMHSNGYYGKFMALKNDEIDRLCDAGIANADPQKRREIYTKLQTLWYEDAIGVSLYQQIVVRAYRDYVYGFVPNAMFTDDNEILKRLFKH